MSKTRQNGTILVTGAAGFIGHTLATRLHIGGADVVGTDIMSPRGHQPGDFRFVQADVRDMPRHMAEIVSGCDGIIHCGGISGPMLAKDNPAELIEINVRGTAQLLELARLFKLRRFIGCSSVSAYGSMPDLSPVREDAPLRASSVYGSSKAAADLLVQTYAGQLGLSAAALRIGWVYGPGRRTDAILQPMIRSGLGGPAYRLESGAEQMLQFVHVDDVVSAMIAAFEAPALRRSAYNTNGSTYLSVAQIAQLVRDSLASTDIALGPGHLDGTDQQGPMVLTAAAEDFGWTPQVSMADGIGAYVNWLGKNEF